MRDRKRLIPIYLKIGISHTEKLPDMRIGQLFENIRTAMGGDLFYIEDDVLLDEMLKWLQRSAEHGDN